MPAPVHIPVYQEIDVARIPHRHNLNIVLVVGAAAAYILLGPEREDLDCFSVRLVIAP